MSRAPQEEGFSLVEALVALLILAIATVGLVRAAEAHIDSIRGLERRAAALWVAENRLVELGLPGAAAQNGEVEMLGRKWQVVATRSGTDDPDLGAVSVAVSLPGESSPVVTLDGFVDAGSTTP
ncbi:type II secretion system protein GspI [Sphingomonas oleivorans]|uniref:Type II secretion system protein I n=1 Tax=Sphingomonas oleivorans TaxID=1735121 RepID=A0A2T5FVP7_9SPHN|nr:type II secretion system minor pseudopilin GspI [Sphingomonas oleivorans]PTQ09849.1 type II secretion system protein GspI [Sphingomonas oleivorans]